MTDRRTAGAGALYQFTHDATANLREKDDCYGEFLAGAAAGTAIGIYSVYSASRLGLQLTAAGGSTPMVLGGAAVVGISMAAWRYTHGLQGYAIKEDDEDEVARKEEMRKMRRRPIQETLEQLGEGRGMIYDTLAHHGRC